MSARRRHRVGWVVLLFVLVGASFAPRAEAGGAFVFGCERVGSAVVDPITDFGRTAGHLHDFLGNRTIGKSSTHESLRAGSGTCNVYGDRAADLSAYWAPAILERGASEWIHHPATHAQVYYRAAISQRDKVQPFPPGLKIIAGSASASKPQSTSVVRWSCDGETPVDGGTRPWCVDNPARPGPPRSLRAEVFFPSCYDGRTDSPDHKSHMTYPVTLFTGERVCPVSHPLPVPEIHLVVRYPTTPGGPDDEERGPIPGAVRLSSGGHYTYHADFFEAWDQVKLRYHMARCMWTDVGSC